MLTYDGHTPPGARRAVRARANLVLTNPDMLHSGILPHHTKWAVLFQNLKYVVIDELHAYRGVFGSHLSNVLRRLRRICAHYGSTPQFIMASATIANPGELAARLTGEDVHELAESGAPSGEKTFLCYNPPVVNPELGIRAPYLGEAAKLAIRLLREKIATIVFAQSRLSTEVLLTAIKSGVSHRATGASGSMPGHPAASFLPATTLKRAAFERPVVADELFGQTDVRKLAAALEDEGLLHRAGERYHWASETYPADHISLRTVTTDNFVVIDTTHRDEQQTKKRNIIAEVDWGSAFATIYPKAIYLVESVPYEVQELRFREDEEKVAYVKRVNVDYFTDAVSAKGVWILQRFEGREQAGAVAEQGEVLVAEKVVGFKKIKLGTMAD